MDLKIKDKWALVTGGCNGIGEEISTVLASEGVNLIVTSRSQDPIDKLKKKLTQFNVSVEGVIVDFLIKDWEKDFFKNLNKFKIDILINNAGHNLNVTNPYCDIEDWESVMNLNFYTVIKICNFLIPHMKKKKMG